MRPEQVAIQFDGKWPAIDVLKAFKPWNKR